MQTTFSGFGAPFFDFFEELKHHNNRAWFQDHKAAYERDVVAQMLAFIEAMGPRLSEISEQYTAIAKKSGGSMFRIYRDIRFSRDKTPYKTHAACQFRHVMGRDAHAPGFYVHLEPDRIAVGGGIWQPPSRYLTRIRETIADSPAAWGKIIGDSELTRRFGGIHGDCLKRAPRGYDPSHPHIADLRRKSFFLMQPIGREAAALPSFVDETAAAFRAADPLMRFICHALDLPF